MDRDHPVRPVQQHAHNLALVARLITAHAPVSRAGLARLSGLTKTTITVLTNELTELGLVRELGVARPNGPGRPATQLVPDSSGPVGVGLQIEADHVAGCLVDLTGRVRERALRRCDDLRGRPAAAVRTAEPVLRRLLHAAAARDTVVAGVAVGVPGRIDSSGAARSTDLGWSAVAVSRLVAASVESLGGGRIPVSAHNGFHLAALAELWFGGVDPGDRPLLWAGGELTVGAALVTAAASSLSAPPVSPATGVPAGELGHVRVRRAGEVCRCGERGCLDTITGPRALGRLADAEAEVRSRLSAGDGAFRALARCDAPGVPAGLRRAANALGEVLGGLVALHDPAAVVLGGPCAVLGSRFAEQLAADLGRRCGRPVVVESSRLGGDAVARAAASVVTRRLLDDPARWLTS